MDRSADCDQVASELMGARPCPRSRRAPSPGRHGRRWRPPGDGCSPLATARSCTGRMRSSCLHRAEALDLPRAWGSTEGHRAFDLIKGSSPVRSDVDVSSDPVATRLSPSVLLRIARAATLEMPYTSTASARRGLSEGGGNEWWSTVVATGGSARGGSMHVWLLSCSPVRRTSTVSGRIARAPAGAPTAAGSTSGAPRIAIASRA